MSLTSQLSSLSAHLQDIPSFSQQSGKAAGAAPSAVAPLLAAQRRSTGPASLIASQPLSLRAAAARPDGASGGFLAHFHDGVKLDAPLSSHIRAEHLRHRDISAHAAHADELERIYRQHAPNPLLSHHPHQQQQQQPRHHAQLTHIWAAEYGAAQPHAVVHAPQQQLHRVHQQIVQQTPHWAAEFEALKQQQQHQQHQQLHSAHQPPTAAHSALMQYSRPMPPLSSYSASYALQRPMIHLPPASLVAQQPAPAPAAFSRFAQPSEQHLQKQQQPSGEESKASLSSSSLGSAVNVHAVPDSDMVDSFPIPSQQSSAQSEPASLGQSAGDGLGGGLNADMIDALLRSDDPKWRQSKFLQFISKIKSGQIEFRDNQAIDTGHSSQADGTAASPTQRQQMASGAEWAEEYSSDEQLRSSFPSAWSEDFEQREGLRDLSTTDDLSRMAAGWSGELSADAEDEKVWEDEYRRVVQGEGRSEDGEGTDMEDEKEWAEQFQQHADFDSFSHINWREALEKARGGTDGATVEAQAAADPQYEFTSPLQSAHSEANAAFEEGVRLLERGELRAAIAAFETAVRLDPEHSEAWCQLGAAQAENEEESNAIAALLKSVAIDPYNLKALMMLGVSYTNDLEESRALQYLKTWSAITTYTHTHTHTHTHSHTTVC